MPSVDVVRDSAVVRTPRVMQLEGLFDLPPSERAELHWTVTLPIEEKPWNVGLIVGPSGAGKSTIARTLFGDAVVKGFDWPDGKSLVDGFPESMGVRQIAELLSSVGLASVPTWIRPFATLSTGEQFRATVARAMAEVTINDSEPPPNTSPRFGGRSPPRRVGVREERSTSQTPTGSQARHPLPRRGEGILGTLARKNPASSSTNSPAWSIAPSQRLAVQQSQKLCAHEISNS